MAVIFSVNNNIDDGLRALGHEVHSVRIGTDGMYTAAEYIAKCPTQPDIFLQKELLGTKVFFSDVHTLSCKTAFWGIDSHLRYWWQMYYAALFDVFFTPHKAFLERLPKEWLHAHMHRLAQCGQSMSYTPHAQRTHNINFVGRLSGTRPQRKALCHLLASRYGIQHKDDLAFAAMLSLYADTRVVPNESISNETNFRLLEATSCGCAVISPHIGEDQDCLFEPEKEILIYTSLDSFCEQMDRCVGDVSFAEALGRRAYERVQREHLAIHRAAKVMQVMENFDPHAREEQEVFLPSRKQQTWAEDMRKFAFSLMHISGVIEINNFPSYTQQKYTITALSILVRLFATLKDVAEKVLDVHEGKARIYALLDEANACLLQSNDPTVFTKMLAVACGGAALQYEDAPRSVFYLHLYEKIARPTSNSSARQSLKGATHTLDVALNWVTVLKKNRKQCFLGNSYLSGCCGTAFDFVSLCKELYPLDMRWMAALATLDHVLSVFPFEEQERLRNAVYGT